MQQNRPVAIGDQPSRFGSQWKIDTEQKVGGTLGQGVGSLKSEGTSGCRKVTPSVDR